MPLKYSKSGFTIIELVIAMALFAMMTVMVMTIYFSTTHTSQRLNAQRLLSSSAREVIERLTEDVEKYGFSGSASPFDDTAIHTPWNKYDYSGSGSEYLNLNNGRYVYGYKTDQGIDACTGNNKTDPRIHCGLYLVSYHDNGAQGYNIIDSFIPLDDDKRVKIKNLRFFVSGNKTEIPGTTSKVTLIMELDLIPRGGATTSLASPLRIQTTISERGWLHP